MTSTKRVAICVPSRGECSAWFAYDLAGLMIESGLSFANGSPPQLAGTEIMLDMAMGCVIDYNRNLLTIRALREKATHLFWCDDDMRFPADALVRLLLHDVSVVGANCVTRGAPINPLACKYTNGKPQLVYTWPDSTGLEQVDRNGFGLVLVAAEVFLRLEPPWFKIELDPSVGYRGEDYEFFRRASELGYPIYIDHDLSKEVRHIGRYEYRMEDTCEVPESQKPKRKAKPFVFR